MEDVNCFLTSHVSWFSGQVVDNRVVRNIGDTSLSESRIKKGRIFIERNFTHLVDDEGKQEQNEK